MTRRTRFIGIDGEMTGGGARGEENSAPRQFQLIQVGAALGETALQIFSSDIGYERWNEDPKAMSVNGISAERIKLAPAPAVVDDALCIWLDAVGTQDDTLVPVGWGVSGFDMPFVREYLPKFARRLSRRSVDLNAIVFLLGGSGNQATRWKAKSKEYAEQEMLKRGYRPNWHDAGYDAAAALLAFEYFQRLVESVKSFRDTLDGYWK